MFIALKLAKLGYYGSNPEKILNAPIDIVLNMLEYEKFENDYMEAFTELNKEN